MRIEINQRGIDELAESGQVASTLFHAASRVADAVDAPAGMEVEVRANKGPNINAQVVMTGVLSGGLGPVGAEYGTSRFPARSPLRRALHNRLR